MGKTHDEVLVVEITIVSRVSEDVEILRQGDEAAEDQRDVTAP